MQDYEIPDTFDPDYTPETPEELRHWVKYARAGSTVIYHRGHLQQDRWQFDFRSALSPHSSHSGYVSREPFNEIARVAYAAYQSGQLALFQRKTGANSYLYYALRRAPRWVS